MSACGTLPKPSKTVMGNAGSAQGQWRGKALIRNLVKKQSLTVDLDIVAREPDHLRIEATGPFGAHLASVVSKEDEVRIALTREKKFLISPADRQSLARIVLVRLSPRDLLALLFDHPLEETNAGWKCEAARAPEWRCQSGSAVVTRNPDEDGRRRFTFVVPEAEMDLVITETKADIAPGDAAYELSPPAGFKIEKRR